MFAALLGYNPIKMLLGSALGKLPPSHAAYLTGHTFFPSLISAPFQHGLDIAFDFAIIASLIAAVASLLRGSKYVHEEPGTGGPAQDSPAEDGTVKARTAEASTVDASTAYAEVSSGDDLEGGQGGVGGVGDPAAADGDLAQRR
jgi:hypothetical protein